LNADQIKRGIDLLSRRIKDVEDFDAGAVRQRWSAEVKTLQTSIEETIDKVFGHNTIEAKRYRPAASLDNGPVFVDGRGNNPSQVQGYLVEGRNRSILLLHQAIKGLEEDLEGFSEHPESHFAHADHEEDQFVQKTDVFIVHGHPAGPREAVARFIDKLGLRPVILHEQASQSRTIIEKFEAHSNTAFAIVLATADDLGKANAEPDLKPRARQNVILELGYFAGKIGRKSVCLLKEGEIDLPSDVLGIAYIDLDGAGGWKMLLARELQAAGFKIDWNKVMN
jgi:CAP12/Pycsar effector protein, TIR domain